MREVVLESKTNATGSFFLGGGKKDWKGRWRVECLFFYFLKFLLAVKRIFSKYEMFLVFSFLLW